MKSLIKTFQETGSCELDIKKVIKKWKDNFAISQYHKEFTFIVFLKNGNTKLKVKITEEQANELITELNLGKIKSTTFKHANTFRTKDFIQSEILRLTEIQANKERELDLIENIIISYQLAIC